MNGWAGKLIRVNLSDETIKTELLNMQDAKLYVGGRGFGTKIYMDEADPKADPLSPENKMIFMTGPLTGTLAPCAGRYEVVAKAPLTGTIGACSSGGHFGPELKYAGYDAVIFEGRAKKPVYLSINDDRIELRDASHLWGKGVSAATDELLKETDEDAKVACIDSAGEKLALSAVIINEKRHAAGGSGLGAVMGSKNLKAIAVRGTKSIRVDKQKDFMEICLKSRKSMKDNPVTKAGLPSYGQQLPISILGRSGSDPAKDRHPSFCAGCSMACRETMIERSEFTELDESPAYDTGRSAGSDCSSSSLQAVCGPLVKQGDAAALKTFQDLTAVVNSTGMCLFTTFAIGLPETAEMLRACTGIEYTDEEVLQIGERIWNIEKIVDMKNGFSQNDDMLPEYYAVRGWDKEGAPTQAKKKELSIE